MTVVGSLSEFINEMMLRSERGSVNRIRIWSQDWENPINEGTLRHLRRVPGVLGTLRQVGGRLDPDDQSTSFTGPDYFYGTTSDISGMEYLNPYSSDPDIALREGRFPAPGSQQEAIASYEIAQKHGWQVGQAITIQDHAFTLVGIWERIPNDLGIFADFIRSGAAHFEKSVVLGQCHRTRCAGRRSGRGGAADFGSGR